MGTILASALITRAQNILVDTGATRWSSSEMLDWLNDAQREIASESPESFGKVANFTTVAGTKQTLPSDAIALLRIVRNMGAGGATPGEAPRRTAAALLDLQNPNWHTAAATLVVKNYTYDHRLPQNYYVYPPMSGATQLEAHYVALPTAIATVGTAITLDDTYANAMLDYLLYRCFSKDIEIPQMANHAAIHKAAFDASVAPIAATKSAEPSP